MTILHIAIYIPGLEFGPDTLKTSSLGGSETAGLQMANALRDRGHRVYVFGNCKPGPHDGIEYLHLSTFPQFASFLHHDVTIVQRVPQVFANRINSKYTVLWCHDMALVRHQDQFMTAQWNIDRTALLSEYHYNQYREVFGSMAINPETVLRTRNGLDLSLFPDPAECRTLENRDRKLLLYSARPERGLDYLLSEIMPRILARDPEYRLGICGYYNPEVALEDFYLHCMELAKGLGDRVVQYGYLTKTALYELYSRSGVYVYPTPTPVNVKFREISCITAMECQSSGLPIVTTAAGALPETIAKGAGTLVDGLPGSPGYADDFVESVFSYADDSRYLAASDAGIQAAAGFSWDTIAREWEEFFIEQIALKSRSSGRLVRHFIRNGDIVAAKQVKRLATFPIPEPSTSPPAIASPVQAATINRWILDSGAKDIKDYGQMAPCYELLKGVRFHEAQFPGEMDAVVICNTLEYQETPWTFLEEQEKKVREGGWIYIVTPFGPKNRDRYWNFDTNDLEDMAGRKPGFDILAYSDGADRDTAEAVGYNYCRYRADRLPVRPIDMDRKLRFQSPRETLSVNIIAGGPKVDGTLHWCLRSVVPVADEIIVVDCGLTDESRRILEQYPVKIVPGKDPLVHGFETPRNIAIKNSTMDWILWIDTDESLIGGECLTKYLRNSMYDGYSIKQYHFGVGNLNEPDMPVRLFRRERGLRFYGMIHEHPEKRLNKGPGLVVILSDVQIMHIGYDSERTRQARFARNLPLLAKDREKYPNRILQKHFVMRDNMIMANNKLAMLGGKVDPEIKALCDETIELWRKWFKGGTPLVGINSLQYYSRACEILGLGVEVAFELSAGKDGYGNNQGGIRFANKSDLMSELKFRADRATEVFYREDF